MNKLLLLLICTGLVSFFSCNSSDFAGASSKGSGKGDKRPDNGGGDKNTGDSDSDGNDSDPDASDNTGNGESDSDDSGGGNDDDIQIDGGEKVNCDDENEKVAAGNENFTFNNEGEVRTFVNAHCKTGISAKFDGAGAVGTDADTAEAVCNLKGFKTGTVQESGKYSSPHNNFIAYWDKSQSKFLLAVATSRNSKIKRLLCDGKFKKQCHDENKKIDCVF